MAGAAGGLPQLVRPVDLAVRDPQRQQDLHHHRVAHRPRRRLDPRPWPRSRCSEPPAGACRWTRLRTRHGARRRTRRSPRWAVELRREESRRPLQQIVRPAQLPVLLLELLDPLRLRRGHPRLDTLVDVGLLAPTCATTRPRSRSAPRPAGSSRASCPSSLRSWRTNRTARAFSSGEYRRVVGLPGVRSFPMTPSSFPRSGASNATQGGSPPCDGSLLTPLASGLVTLRRRWAPSRGRGL